MPPRQVTPIRPSGIILVIKMPHPVEIYHAVGIIHPVGNRGVMNLRTVFPPALPRTTGGISISKRELSTHDMHATPRAKANNDIVVFISTFRIIGF